MELSSRNWFVVIILIFASIILRISARNIPSQNYYSSGSRGIYYPPQVQLFNQHDPNEVFNQGVKFPTEEEDENDHEPEELEAHLGQIAAEETPRVETSNNNNEANNVLPVAVPRVPDSSLPVVEVAAKNEEYPDVNPEELNLLKSLDLTKLTPAQKEIYDELIELAAEEEQMESSQVQGRTFGLFKLKFNFLWNKFKSLLGPKYFEFYAGEPQLYGSGGGQGQPHYYGGGDDFKKRNEGIPQQGQYYYEQENPIFQIPIVGGLTKFITRTIPKFLFEDTFGFGQQTVQKPITVTYDIPETNSNNDIDQSRNFGYNNFFTN